MLLDYRCFTASWETVGAAFPACGPHKEDFDSSTEMRVRAGDKESYPQPHQVHCKQGQPAEPMLAFSYGIVIWVKYTQTGLNRPFCIFRQGAVGQGWLLSEELRRWPGLQPRGERWFIQHISPVYLESGLGCRTHSGPARLSQRPTVLQGSGHNS